MLYSVWIPGQATVRRTNSTAAPSPGLLEGQRALVLEENLHHLIKLESSTPFRAQVGGATEKNRFKGPS